MMSEESQQKSVIGKSEETGFLSTADPITKVGVLLSLFSIFSLVVSYVSHLIFYSFFGIPISNYIQIGEAVVLFLPQLVAYIAKFFGLLTLVMIFFLFAELTLTRSKPNKLDFKPEPVKKKSLRQKRFVESDTNFIPIQHTISELVLLYRVFVRNIFRFRFKNGLSFLRRSYIVTVRLCLSIFLLVIGPSLLWVTQIEHETDTSFRVSLGAQFFFLLFFLGSFDYIFAMSKRWVWYRPNMITDRYLNLFRIICHISSVAYLQVWAVTTDIKSGHPQYQVTFTYNSKIIKTDTSTVYIGGTQNYIFLRKRSSKVNMVFKMNNVDNLLIKELNHEINWFGDVYASYWVNLKKELNQWKFYQKYFH